MAEPQTLFLSRVTVEQVNIVVRPGETQKAAIERVMGCGTDQIPWLPHHVKIEAAIGRGMRTVRYSQGQTTIHRVPPYDPTGPIRP